jgi:inosose dehydratase
VKLAAAPISWGVSEVPGWGVQLDPDRVLDEIADAGLDATELGPAGFLPADPVAIRERLGARGLALVGGFVPAVLHHTAERAAGLHRVRESAALLADAGATVLVLAAATGETGYDAPYRPDAVEWEVLRGGLGAAQQIAAERGLTLAFHPHYGTWSSARRTSGSCSIAPTWPSASTPVTCSPRAPIPWPSRARPARGSRTST